MIWLTVWRSAAARKRLLLQRLVRQRSCHSLLLEPRRARGLFWAQRFRFDTRCCRMPLADMVDAHGSPVTSPGRTVFVRIFDRGALGRATGSQVGDFALHRRSRYWIGLEMAVPTAPREVAVGDLAVSVLLRGCLKS